MSGSALDQLKELMSMIDEFETTIKNKPKQPPQQEQKYPYESLPSTTINANIPSSIFNTNIPTDVAFRPKLPKGHTPYSWNYTNIYIEEQKQRSKPASKPGKKKHSKRRIVPKKMLKPGQSDESKQKFELQKVDVNIKIVSKALAEDIMNEIVKTLFYDSSLPIDIRQIILLFANLSIEMTNYPCCDYLLVHWNMIKSIIASQNGFILTLNFDYISFEKLQQRKRMQLFRFTDGNHTQKPLISISLAPRKGMVDSYWRHHPDQWNNIKLNMYLYGLRRDLPSNVEDEVKSAISQQGPSGWYNSQADIKFVSHMEKRMVIPSWWHNNWSIKSRTGKVLAWDKSMLWDIDCNTYRENLSKDKTISIQLKFEWNTETNNGYKISIKSFTDCFKLSPSNTAYEPRIANIRHFQSVNINYSTLRCKFIHPRCCNISCRMKKWL